LQFYWLLNKMLKKIRNVFSIQKTLRYFATEAKPEAKSDPKQKEEDDDVPTRKIKVRGSVNRAIVCGYVGASPKTQNVKTGSITRFWVATTETFKTRLRRVDNTTWHQIIVYNPIVAENVQKNVKKGMFVYVEGVIHHYKAKDGKGNVQILCNHPSNLKILNGEIEIETKEEKDDKDEKE
jgi:single stranded DNA-binding protein